MNKKARSLSRTQKRYMRKTSVRPIPATGDGQGGFMTPSGSAGSGWG